MRQVFVDRAACHKAVQGQVRARASCRALAVGRHAVASDNIHPPMDQKLLAHEKLLAASGASLVAAIVTNPLEVLKVWLPCVHGPFRQRAALTMNNTCVSSMSLCHHVRFVQTRLQAAASPPTKGCSNLRWQHAQYASSQKRASFSDRTIAELRCCSPQSSNAE